MTPETKKALIIGVAVIGGAGLFAYIYSKRDMAGAANAAANQQAEQDSEELAEVEAVEGQDGSVNLEPVGATSQSPGATTLGGELESIYSDLGISNPSAPASPGTSPVSSTPSPVSGPGPAPLPSVPSTPVSQVGPPTIIPSQAGAPLEPSSSADPFGIQTGLLPNERQVPSIVNYISGPYQN
jgi:hypothetical protein